MSARSLLWITPLTLGLVACIAAGAQTQYTIDTFAKSSIPDGTPALGAALLPRGVSVGPSGVPYTTSINVYRLGADGSLTTAAGTTMNYSGDGGPANQAQIWDPWSVAFDKAGNMYIADTGNSVIRKVDAATGVISTIAGTGDAGHSGDGGKATQAKLNSPIGIAVDPSGNVYFSDLSPSVIRKITQSTGIITDVAGVFSAVRSANPRGLAMDAAGNLYIAERGSHKILKFSPATSSTVIVAGSSQGFGGDGQTLDKALLSLPQAVAFDGAGNLYIADNGNHRVRMISADFKSISTVAGSGARGADGDGGPALSASFSDVFTIAADNAGNVYVADTYNGKVRMIGGDGSINTIAGGNGGDGGPATQSQFIFPALLTNGPDGSLYVTELNRVRKIDSSGIITTVAGNGSTGFSGDNGPATSASLGLYPNGTALDAAGNLYIADTSNNVIRRVDSSTGVITTAVGDPQQLFCILVPNGPAASASLCSPQAVAFDSAGNMYISNNQSSAVYVVDTAGRINLVNTGSLSSPTCLYVDQSAGNLYICDTGHSTIVKVNLASKAITTVAGIKNQSGDGPVGGPATAAKLNDPQALATDLAGNLLIADFNNSKIYSVDKSGVITTIAGTGDFDSFGDGGPATAGAFKGPDGLAVDSAGNIYVADFFNHAVRILRPASSQNQTTSTKFRVMSDGGGLQGRRSRARMREGSK